jgi:hypothetical protein
MFILKQKTATSPCLFYKAVEFIFIVTDIVSNTHYRYLITRLTFSQGTHYSFRSLKQLQAFVPKYLAPLTCHPL